MKRTSRDSSDSPFIVAEQVGMRFTTGRGASSVKSVILEKLGELFGRAASAPESRDFWTLQGVDLELKEGDRLGIVGRNGAGKTTMLRVLSGIYPPTSGSLRINGSIAPVLQLGLGFNAELTGRENVLVSAAIAGMPLYKMKKRIDSIFEFAELQEYLDIQLKYYSSGMYARLAFSVATELDTDILLLDEVFAVGDIHWVERALERIEKLIDRVGILVLVSHDLGLIERICNRAILLEDGSIQSEGSVGEVLEHYRASP